MNKFLIIGLGNVGAEYAHTRHNIGFDVVHAFVSKYGGNFSTERLAYKADVKWKGRSFTCICPTTYMNRSGLAVRYWKDIAKVELKNMLVVLDDLALPLQMLRLKASGSDGGHNGLKDIQLALETTDYPRLRFGIGNNFPKGLQSDYVLSKWTKEEDLLVKIKVEKCVEVIEKFSTIGISATMTEVNKLSFSL
jgi:PTH1 family peptidyl-tRNA hydrolase